MTRNGKIARLPQSIRGQINLRLQNGEEGKQIVEWLNPLPEVTAILAAEFDGQPINEPNLSHWKSGGYRDWEQQQEALAAVRRVSADAAELGQEVGVQLTEHLALCLNARLAAALRQPPAAGEDATAQLEYLRRLCSAVGRLRKGDHNARWLSIQQAKMDLLAKKHEEEAADRKKQQDPSPKRREGGFSKETITQLEKDLHLF